MTLLQFFARGKRRAPEQIARKAQADALAGASCAILPETTIRLYYGIDLDDMTETILRQAAIDGADRIAVAERLRSAALRAIDREMAAIRAERR